MLNIVYDLFMNSIYPRIRFILVIKYLLVLNNLLNNLVKLYLKLLIIILLYFNSPLFTLLTFSFLCYPITILLDSAPENFNFSNSTLKFHSCYGNEMD